MVNVLIQDESLFVGRLGDVRVGAELDRDYRSPFGKSLLELGFGEVSGEVFDEQVAIKSFAQLLLNRRGLFAVVDEFVVPL